jgi:hypothetical protein
MGVLLILLGPLDVMLPMFCKPNNTFFWTGSQFGFGSFLLHSNQIFLIFICSFRFRKKQQLYSHVSAHPSVEMAADRLFRKLPCQHECRMTYPALLPLLVCRIVSYIIHPGLPSIPTRPPKRQPPQTTTTTTTTQKEGSRKKAFVLMSNGSGCH